MLRKEAFFVKGMDCQEEVRVLKKILQNKEGVCSINFDLVDQKLVLEIESEIIDVKDILHAIRSAGMKVVLWKYKLQLTQEGACKRHGHLVMTILSGLFLLVGLFSNYYILEWILKHVFHYEKALHLEYLPFVSRASNLLSVIFGLWYVLPKAFSSLRHIRIDIYFLMFFAVLGALFIGHWFEAGSVAFLFSLSLLLEGYSLSRTRNAIGKLMDIAPKRAMVKKNGKISSLNVSEVKIGDEVVVKPGEKIALDGIIISGETLVDESPITGESSPKPKDKGNNVFGGTLNLESSITVQVSKAYSDTTLAKMLYLIEEAKTKRAKTDQWIDGFAHVYTPIMLVLSIAIAIAPPLALGLPWLTWIYRALVVLVIACPCALVISTPVAVVSAISSAAHAGVLVKGGMFIEIPSNLKAVAFDKTGTLTKGSFQVEKIISFSELSDMQLLAHAASLETHSDHPLARATLEFAKENNVPVNHDIEAKVFPGKGIEGKINEESYWIGSHRLVHEKNIETKDIHDQINALEEQGYSILIIGNQKSVLGIIALLDEVRDSACETLKQLKATGVKELVMLTGDNSASARKIAERVGLTSFFSELLPEKKVEYIESLKEKHGTVAMVGDGINDAAAMASSSLGIAMGVMGSEVALETADIALMDDNLKKLPWLVRHSKRALRIIKQNIIFALCIKALFLTLAISGYASLWMAIAADTGATLIVVFNAIRLLKAKA